jgi:hypothetical protein
MPFRRAGMRMQNVPEPSAENGGASDALTTPHLLAISPDGHSPKAGVMADKG